MEQSKKLIILCIFIRKTLDKIVYCGIMIEQNGGGVLLFKEKFTKTHVVLVKLVEK